MKARFGDYEFDAASGELRRLRAAGPDERRRLAPQPARLLALLVGRRGALVTREEIRASIWPDVTVDFEQGLHFCVRQVRTALDDTASDPRYIETLPRRGYRLIPEVHVVCAATRDPPAARRWFAAACLLFAVAVAVAGSLLLDGPAPGRPLRIAVMPFLPPEAWGASGGARPIAEWILQDLTLSFGDRAGIVGPSSTTGYDDSAGSLRKLAADYELSYIVNGRFIDGEDGPRMLAELIRVSDGAHVWVRSYEDLSEGRRIGEEIGRNVARELGLERGEEG